MKKLLFLFLIILISSCDDFGVVTTTYPLYYRYYDPIIIHEPIMIHPMEPPTMRPVPRLTPRRYVNPQPRRR